MPNSIFANARAAALSGGLLGAERLNRMIDCASPEDALKILREVGFGAGSAADGSETETLIEAEETAFAAFVRETSPAEKLTRFLLARWDYRNAEAVMRSKYLKTDYRTMTGTEGVYPLALLQEKIFSDDYAVFGKHLGTALTEADALFVGGTATGKKISVLFSRAQFAELVSLAGRDKLLREIVAFRADAANIGISLRARDARLASEMTVPGGTLSEEDFRVLAQESAETVRDRFRRSPRRDLIYDALEDAEKGRPLIALEKASESCALAVFSREKYNDEGYRLFFRYCCEKLTELGNVRLVMSCLASDVDKATIRARVRSV